MISFHELSITAYTFLQTLDKRELESLAEEVPQGPSTQRLIKLAQEYDICILAGLVEKHEENLFNTYICVDANGLIAKFSKLHPLIHPDLSVGNQYVVFDLRLLFLNQAFYLLEFSVLKKFGRWLVTKNSYQSCIENPIHLSS